jgi:glutamine synthetase
VETEDRSPTSARRLAVELERGGVEAIALSYVDNSGITRVKTIPPAKLVYADTTGIGMSPAFDTFLLDDSGVRSRTAGGPVGDLRLHPDLDRLVPLSAMAGWAWAPVDRRRQDGSPHAQCQRHFVRRMIERLADLGLTAQMAFELEWMVSAGPGPAFDAPRDPAYGMNRVIEHSDYVADLYRALRDESLAVEQIHPEYSPGQFEVSVEPSDPLGSADDVLLVRQTIRAVGERHGLRTTFSPVVALGGVGNGGHVHLSVWEGDRNLFAGGDGRHGMHPTAEAFLAGILAELPALLAVGAPSVASYLRLAPRRWTGDYGCWGLENREAAVRLVTVTAGHESRGANGEVKCFDQTASPYLVAGAVLACGVAGIQSGLRLPEELAVDPGTLGDDELARRQVRRLPTTLLESVERYEKSEVLVEALGDSLHETIAAVRRGEAELFAGATDEEVVAATLWRHG